MITLLSTAADFSLLPDTAPRAVSVSAFYADNSPAPIFTQTGVISVSQFRDGFSENSQICVLCSSGDEASLLYSQILDDAQKLNDSIH
jgi:hypothetical protein